MGFFLATIDEKVSGNALDDMRRSRVYLVVPVRLKRDIEVYSDAVNVISFEEFFAHYLGPSMTRWRERHAITG